jgi:hypothetical protein
MAAMAAASLAVGVGCVPTSIPKTGDGRKMAGRTLAAAVNAMFFKQVRRVIVFIRFSTVKSRRREPI